jgi:hypothetical protein
MAGRQKNFTVIYHQQSCELSLGIVSDEPLVGLKQDVRGGVVGAGRVSNESLIESKHRCILANSEM